MWELRLLTGHHFLGAVRGDNEYYMQRLIFGQRSMNEMSQAAYMAPQAAFASLIKSLQCERNSSKEMFQTILTPQSHR